MGDYAFYGCESLESIVIPSSLTAAGSYVFGACHELKKLTIENGVTGIGYGMFANAVALQKWLLCTPNAALADWKAADMCEDERLDAFDLCLMKRELLYQ